ncbi:SRPBCC domain-containing protein [Rhodobacteraceae bacterium]|nr:SRPBCC domain-containing protein [Paracoccaceae bacterium]
MTTHPIVKTIHVNLDPKAAFDLFTRRISEWWPVESHSVSAGKKEVPNALMLEAKKGGALVETGVDGAKHVWGHILEWSPGEAFAMTWHPGKSPDEKTKVHVQFQSEAAGTQVTLTHSGWEALENSAGLRAGYNGGWDGVLGRYSAVS